MILIAFEDDIFPQPKQDVSGMDNWEEDEIDSSQYQPEESDTIIISV